MKRIKPVDSDARDRIRKSRGRNLIIDAGAGTGKTQLIVDRVIDLIAPETPGVAPILLDRMAVITFTRRAAGELRFRIRSALLAKLGDPKTSEPRLGQLRRAIEQIDTAFLGTIHSFADRLLRMRPIEARLSPNYEIVDDIGSLAEETYRLLLHAAEAGTLPGEVTRHRELADEVQQTLCDFCRAGLRLVTRDLGDHVKMIGLDRFVRKVLENRDVLPHAGPPGIPDLTLIKSCIRTHIASVDGLTGTAFGHEWLRWRRKDLAPALDTSDPVEALAIIQACLGRKPTDGLTRHREFADDSVGWDLWKEFWGGSDSELDGGVGAVVRPLHNWMGTRLARTIPVIIELYERIKTRHEVVDFLDVLLKLRDVLRLSEPHAHFCQLFDHILVDEFQDTDPLQAEVLFYLTSPGDPQEDWRNSKPAAGRLTIVGDPKQSIYRFRRADILMYDEVCRLLHDAQRETLEANFRSTPALVKLFNGQLGELLGRHDEEAFDRATGQAYYHDLRSSFEDGPPTAVHRLSFAAAGGLRKDRRAEANALARHLRWLKEQNGLQVRHPLTNEYRGVEYGDVAVLARTTLHLDKLFRAFEEYGIPYVSRGGTLFVQEPIVQRFILGLRAIADADDGVAKAALYRPPFFALDAGEVVSGRHEEAEAIVQELRKLRFTRPPVATAMDLLNRTGFGRFLAVSPNGEQKLDAVHHLINQMDVIAQSEGLLFDAITERLRAWIDEPVQMDAPAPIERSAVQILTIHQAKGLEFPVAVLWDGFEAVTDRTRTEPWVCSRDGTEWAIGLYSFRAASPESDLLEKEAAWQDAERLRLYYVAATRARDLLIVPAPQPGGKAQDPARYMCARILAGSESPLVEPLESDGYADIDPVEPFPELVADDSLDQRQAQHHQQWDEALVPASRPRAITVAFTELVKAARASVTTDVAAAAGDGEISRFGPAFGRTVHRALARLLSEDADSLKDIVCRAAIVEQLGDHVEEAAQDVERAMKALEAEGILGPGVTRAAEYSLLLATTDSKLLIGYADLVAKNGKVTWLIDYKTDPPGALDNYPGYAEQVRLYALALAQAGVAPVERIRAGLLFTADGGIRWVTVTLDATIQSP